MKQSAKSKGLLNRESVQVLNAEQLREVWGGYPTDVHTAPAGSDGVAASSLLLDDKPYSLANEPRR